MRSPVASLLAALVVLVGLLTVLRPGADRSTGGRGPAGMAAECEIDPAACEYPGPPGEFPTETGPTVLAAEVCPRSAYLCHGFRERGVTRVMRWPDDVDEIEVRVPRPAHVDGANAGRLQSAAIRGIMAWQNSPFPIRISRSERPGSEDFTVTWGLSAVGTELGRTATEWEQRGEVSTMRVVELVLATHTPGAAPRPLDARIVELTAAHEMGHALGLPHSDDEGDLMYPTNTAARLSTRDYRAMTALYALENGAELIDGAR